MKLELKRGDSRDITITTDKSVAPVGSTAYFMAKPGPDDDLNDAAAVINKQADSIKDAGGGKVRIQFNLSPDDTMNINTGDEDKVQFKGEVEIHTTSGRVISIPSGKKYIEVIIYPDIRRGGNG